MTRTLASYEYIQDQNRYLEILEYGNGDKVQYTYDDYGRLLLETFEDGDPVVYYTYDAWGKLLSTTGSLATTLGLHNPLRYRGYVYDSETQLYYLQSRYYNPEWGRFINADAFVSTGQGLLGNNMFAYCLNNPVNCYDYTGYAAITRISILDDPTKEMFFGFGGGGGASTKMAAGAHIILQGMRNSDDKELQDLYETFVDIVLIDSLNDVPVIIDNLKQNAIVEGFTSTNKIRTGVSYIKRGAGLLLTPMPSTAKNLIGVGLVATGVIYAAYGVATTIAWIGDRA